MTCPDIVQQRRDRKHHLTATILLIRHAAHADLDVRLSGRRPGVPLSEAGEAQAAALGRRLAGAGVSRVTCSPLERTLATARAVASACGLAEPETADALTEIEFGGWTGRDFASLGDDPAWRAWNEERHRARPPGGESMAAAQARVAGWLHATAAARPGETIAAVSHADMIRAAVADVLGLSLDKLLRFDIDPASVTTVLIGKWGARLLGLNAKGN